MLKTFYEQFLEKLLLMIIIVLLLCYSNTKLLENIFNKIEQREQIKQREQDYGK